MRRLLFLFSVVLLALPTTVAAGDNPRLTLAVQDFLHQRLDGEGGEVHIQVREPSARLPACEQPEPFMPGNNQPRWGRVSVGVRCGEQGSQVRYLQARVSVIGEYWVSATDLPAGARLEREDLQRERGDLGELPRNAERDAEQLLGRITNRALSAGSVMQSHLVRQRPLVERRQPVTLEAGGEAFRVTREGEALDNGVLGEEIRVRLEDRQVVSARVSGEGRAQVPF